ncbi:hypothetical protein BD626DRAFT_372584, partial [Schizophyllum amplum]
PQPSPWFDANYLALHRQFIGNEFTELVLVWTELESKHDFETGKGKSVKVAAPKPDILQVWIAAGQTHSKKQPVVSDIAQFASQVTAWWAAMQPEWRVIAADGIPEEGTVVAGRWGQALEVHGQNGMLSVVACLYW